MLGSAEMQQYDEAKSGVMRTYGSRQMTASMFGMKTNWPDGYRFQKQEHEK